jgi:GNAT superfamily N-acetyltransferase
LGIDLLNENHDKHICQESLNLYRGDYRYIVDSSEDVLLMFVAIHNGEVVGMAAAILSAGATHNSIFVVNEKVRGCGIGRVLMRHKVDYIRAKYPAVKFSTKVSVSNETSMKACKAAGLQVVDEGIDSRPEKEDSPYVIFG